MKNQITNYKDYTIITEEGTQKGIFFRNPLQKVSFDAYYDEPKLSAWKYLHDIKNPIRRMYEILIGNRNIVKNIQKWSENYDWGGFTGNILCFPIYFHREYCKLTAVSCSKDANIQEIHSYGYESEFESCAGGCDVEKTKVKLRNGKRIRIVRKGNYYFTYAHIAKKVIDSGSIED